MHAPRRATETTDQGPSVVVREPGSQQYQEKWADATVVTKRRSPSMASIPGVPPKRTNWVSIGIWVAVGVAAFGLGGLLTQLKSSSGGTGTVVEASGPAQAPATPTSAAPPQIAEGQAPTEEADAPQAMAEPEAETLDPSELEQAKPLSPRGTTAPKNAASPKNTALPTNTALPKPAPPKATAPPAKVTAPAKGGIPSEI